MQYPLEKLHFAVNVSARYHDRRRARFDFWHKFVLTVAVLSGTSAIAGVGLYLDQVEWGKWIILAAGFIVTGFSTFDLVIGFAPMARQHDALFRQFVMLEVEFAKEAKPSEEMLREWNARFLEICAEEPTKFYGVYASAWNQATHAMELNQAQALNVRLHWFKYLLRHFAPWDAVDFPPLGRSA